MGIFDELADNEHSGCSEVVGADSQKGGHHHIQYLPKKILFADPDSSVGERIKKARQNKIHVNHCHNKAEKYLKQKNVVLETSKTFVYRTFILCEVF